MSKIEPGTLRKDTPPRAPYPSHALNLNTLGLGQLVQHQSNDRDISNLDENANEQQNSVNQYSKFYPTNFATKPTNRNGRRISKNKKIATSHWAKRRRTCRSTSNHSRTNNCRLPVLKKLWNLTRTSAYVPTKLFFLISPKDDKCRCPSVIQPGLRTLYKRSHLQGLVLDQRKQA